MSNSEMYISIDEKPYTGELPTTYIDFKYPLDNFQLYGCKAIDDNENVLATAHTGSGKTTLALYAIAKCFKLGQKVIYTSPIKTLSNQKFKEFSELFPSVGIITGDVKINPTAQCLIMTAEILRNSLLRKHDDTIYDWNFNPEEVSFVILDEVHFINNKERGRVWEEIIINLPTQIRLVMLSATISGAIDMVKWVGELKKIKCHLVSTNKRPIPLKHTIFWDNKLITYLDNDTNWHHTKWQETKKEIDKYFLKNRFTNRFFHSCINYLKTNNLVPATVFLLNREAVEAQAKTLPNYIDDYMEAAEIKDIWTKHLLKYRDIYEHTVQWSMLYDLVCKGIGIHHSGMIPVLKEIVEILYDKGLIKVLLATETFAMGVNMPTKTVIFTNVTKYDGNHKRLFRPEEYGQMAGRAGRRGKDKEGLIVVLPFPDFITENEAKTFIMAPPQKINSKLSIDYSLILKLLNYKIDIKNTDNPIDFLTEKLSNTLFNSQGYKEINLLINDKNETNVKLEQLEISNANIKDKRETYDKLAKVLDELKPKGIFSLNKKVEKQLINEKRILENEFTPVELKKFEQWVSTENKLKSITNEIEFTKNKLNIHIQKLLSYLKTKEMIDDNFVLTKKGRIIAEINECNPLLLNNIIESKMLEELDFPSIMGILSIFVADKDKDDLFISDLNISEKEKQFIDTIVNFKTDLEKDEIKLVQETPFHFNSEWLISLNMIESVKEWALGNNWLAISSKYDNFEGNFIKNILRLCNLTRNIETIAKLLDNTILLNKLEGYEEKLIRDIVITDSLYL